MASTVTHAVRPVLQESFARATLTAKLATEEAELQRLRKVQGDLWNQSHSTPSAPTAHHPQQQPQLPQQQPASDQLMQSPPKLVNAAAVIKFDPWGLHPEWHKRSDTISLLNEYVGFRQRLWKLRKIDSPEDDGLDWRGTGINEYFTSRTTLKKMFEVTAHVPGVGGRAGKTAIATDKVFKVAKQLASQRLLKKLCPEYNARLQGKGSDSSTSSAANPCITAAASPAVTPVISASAAPSASVGSAAPTSTGPASAAASSAVDAASTSAASLIAAAAEAVCTAYLRKLGKVYVSALAVELDRCVPAWRTGYGTANGKRWEANGKRGASAWIEAPERGGKYVLLRSATDQPFVLLASSKAAKKAKLRAPAAKAPAAKSPAPKVGKAKGKAKLARSRSRSYSRSRSRGRSYSRSRSRGSSHQRYDSNSRSPEHGGTSGQPSMQGAVAEGRSQTKLFVNNLLSTVTVGVRSPL